MVSRLATFILAASQIAAADLPSVVTRADAIALAERYVRHRWKASEKNVFHGLDAEGIRVNTPDAAFRPTDGATRPGWWIPGGAKNVGVPYKWGGFDLPEEFDRGVREGRAAGDIYTAEKRKLLEAAVSRHAVGIDCSGLISRCWKLPRSYSTRELTALCDPVRDLAQLKPGDIFNLHNAHVVLFAAWKDNTRQRLFAYEAGSPPSWKAQCNDIPISLLTGQGYTAWRYRAFRD